MESPSSLPNPFLPKSASRAHLTPTASHHLQTSDRTSSAIPRLLPKIKEECLQTDSLAAVSECSLSDLPDPVIISGQSASDLPLLSRISDTTEEQKRPLLVPKVHGEHLDKGRSDGVISASDLIGNALDDINQAKDVLNDTKKIMDAMLNEVTVLRLNGTDYARRAVRVADPYFMIKLRIAALSLFILVWSCVWYSSTALRMMTNGLTDSLLPDILHPYRINKSTAHFGYYG